MPQAVELQPAAKLDLKTVVDAAATTLPAAAPPSAGNSSLASALSSNVLSIASHTAERATAAVPAANLKVGAQDGRAPHGEAGTPKPAPETGNKQEAASQRGFERAMDSSTGGQPESPRSNANDGFSQELAAAASSRNDAARGTATGNSPATGILPMSGGLFSVGVTEQSAATAASSNPPAANSPATPSPNPPLDPSSANHFVNDAQLLQNAGHSEMRIAMQTDKLGAIELRAHMTGDEVGAAITVEKRDAHTALAAELPALQQALSEKMLRVEQVVLIHGPLHATVGDSAAQQFGGQAPGHDRHAGNAQRGGAAAGNSGDFQASQNFTADGAEIFDSQGRLSVHA